MEWRRSAIPRVYPPAMRIAGIGALIVVCAACGGGDAADPDAGGGAHKRIFVTDATWLGGFWITSPSWPSAFGTDNADGLCTSAAAGAGLGGRWKAWLSSWGTSYPVFHAEDLAADRIADVGPWVLVGTDTVVFNNKANLLNTPLVAIDVNEHGVTLPSGPVWTGARVGGQVLDDCGEWETQEDQITGTVGELSATGNAWTEAGSLTCRTQQAHLYCIEQ